VKKEIENIGNIYIFGVGLADMLTDYYESEMDTLLRSMHIDETLQFYWLTRFMWFASCPEEQ
jgi:hypothetical protein